jgi:uncharacterized delta-60 repeat protein
MSNLFKYSFFSFCLFISSISLSQPGAIDLSFNANDQGLGIGDGANNWIFSVANQSDGKIIIGGQFTSYNGTRRNCIARLNNNGTIDSSFNPGTGANGLIYSIAIQSNGKIIIGGMFNSYNGISCQSVARLNNDGSLDQTFTSPFVSNNSVQIRSVAVQTDGKILIGGSFTVINTSRNYISRLNSDGSFDATFNVGGLGTDLAVTSIAIQSDGKIVIAGIFTKFNGTSRNGIARINANGSLDVSFNPGTGSNNGAQTLAIQSDGKIIIGGLGFSTFNGVSRVNIARLNTNGSLDLSFDPGIGVGGGVWTISIQSDGKILIAGGLTFYNGTPINRIARINPNGSLDNTFNPSTSINRLIYSIAMQAGGKIIAGGEFTLADDIYNHLLRTDTDGKTDMTFNPGSGTNNLVNDIVVQTDGKSIIAGRFTAYNNTSRRRIARLNTDGSLDNTFNPGTGANDESYSLAVLTDGDILIGGKFTSYNGSDRNKIARLNSDGSLDINFPFNAGGTTIDKGLNGDVRCIVPQSNGSIIVGGTFTSFTVDNTIVYSRERILRLLPNGTLDQSFNPGTGISGALYAIALQNDGKIIIGGNFTSYNGITRNHIARLNTDGSLDLTFNPGTGGNIANGSGVFSIAIQNDGKIIIAGGFSSFNGIPRNKIARLNADGSLDASFTSGLDAGGLVCTDDCSGSINNVVLQTDGRIIIAGGFFSYNRISRNSIARLNNNGSLDLSFDPGKGVVVGEGGIAALTVQADDRVLIGGSFTNYNGVGRNRVARLLNSFPTNISSIAQSPNLSAQLFPNPFINELAIKFSTSPKGIYEIQLYNNVGIALRSYKTKNQLININLKDLNSGIYYLKINGGQNILFPIYKLVKN